MRDDVLRASLATVEGDSPSPAFVAALLSEVDAELAYPRPLADYAGGAVPDLGLIERRPEGGRERSRRRWLAASAVLAAAVALLVGLVVVPGGDGSRVATTRLPHGYTAAVLPAAIIQGADRGVVIEGDPATGLDPVVPSWYAAERAAVEADGFVAGLTVPFDLRVAGADEACRDGRRPTPGNGAPQLPCAGSSSALLFADDVGAVHALDVLAGHLEANSAGVYGLGVVLERGADFEVPVGDEAEAFVLEGFVHARVAARVVVVAWRTDNLVQVVWDIQDREAAGGVEALIEVAEGIGHRTAAQRQAGGR